MESKVAKNICTGCGVCLNICLKNAIEMKMDNEGFLYPVIDKTKCIDCNLCAKKCPAVNKVEKHPEQENVYAICGSDEICLRSSSGGAFELIANQFFTEGGYICGASWSDDFKKVEHIIISDKKDLHKLQTSKYVQSEIGNSYKEVKTLLEEGKKVLFSGTPCQVGGLKSFLGKDYENLLTIDILCHSAPSPMVWRKYLEELTRGKEIVNVSHRSKKSVNGHRKHTALLIDFKDGTNIYKTVSKSDYLTGFSAGLLDRKSCATCNYASVARVGDITLADFWKLEEFDSSIDTSKGVSLCIVNNSKAESYITSLEKECKVFKKVPIKYAVNGNPVMAKPSRLHPRRNMFFRNFNPFFLISKQLSKYLYNDLYDGVIVDFWYKLNNYGAVITGWALQQYFEEHGYDYRMLNYATNGDLIRYRKFPTYSFVKKHMRLTEEIKSKKDLQNLNKTIDNYVVGSDQVFKEQFLRKAVEKFLFTETDFSKRRVGFSASFGLNKFECEDYDLRIYKRYFRRFDAISTREKSGVDVCKNTFGVDAEHIIDPVFLVNKDKYNQLIDENNKKYENKIVGYVFKYNNNTKEAIDALRERTGLDFIDIYGVSIEEYLTAIKTCKYFITDSFHGTCFALLFKKNFANFAHIYDNERLKSLFETFNIEKPELTNKYYLHEFSEEKLTEIENIIIREKQKAEEWFNRVFVEPKKPTLQQIENEFEFVKYKNEKFMSKMQKSGVLATLFSIKSIGNLIVIHLLGIKISIKKNRKNK